MPGSGKVIVLGHGDIAERRRQARETFAANRPPPTLRAADAPAAQAEALLDGAFGDLLAVRVEGGPGGRTRLHTHDCDQLLVITSGPAIIATETEEHELPTGTVVLVPAGVAHVHASPADGERRRSSSLERRIRPTLCACRSSSPRSWAPGESKVWVVCSPGAVPMNIANGLLDRVRECPTFDFVEAIAHPLPSLVICELIGIPERDRAAQGSWTPAIQRAMASPSLAAHREAGEVAAAAQWAYLEDLAEERRQEPGDDLLSALILAEEQGQRLSHDELIATLIFLFSAGHSTTRDLLGSGLLAMLADRDRFAKLAAEPSLSVAAVEESLRFESPITMLRRRAVADTFIDNTRIRAGEHVVAVLLAANRDPDRFDEPDRFIIDRPGNKPVSFGGGIHFCVGAALARMEAEVVFHALATRSPDLALADGRIEWRDTPVFRGPVAVKVARKHSQ